LQLVLFLHEHTPTSCCWPPRDIISMITTKASGERLLFDVDHLVEVVLSINGIGGW
jgi:hypothetical protein